MPGDTVGLMLINKICLQSAGILVLFLSCFSHGYSQADFGNQPVRIMFYNVENLFDTRDDTLINDNEFLPSGVRRWNQSRYYHKINSIYKTIIAAGEWSTPDIVGLCEVENRSVLEDLIYRTYLSKHNYGIVHEDSPDERGIDVCMIYRRDIVKILNYSYMRPLFLQAQEFRTRSVLYLKCLISEDTIHLLLNHWPSRRGGTLPSEPVREKLASLLRNVTDSIGNDAGGKAKILIIGDFNCTPDDVVMQNLLTSHQPGKDWPQIKLINISVSKGRQVQGTYKYSGTWEIIDQIIVSEWLLKCSSGLYTEPDGYRIFSPGFLLVPDRKFPGFTPFSTYRGYRYQGGFSDHLPVIVDLKVH